MTLFVLSPPLPCPVASLYLSQASQLPLLVGMSGGWRAGQVTPRGTATPLVGGGSVGQVRFRGVVREREKKRKGKIKRRKEKKKRKKKVKEE